jgi:hypothetical protein
MSTTQPSKIFKSGSRRVAAYRDKVQRQGLLRLEVTVPRHDAVFIRRAAETLRHGGDKAQRLREQMSEAPIRTGADLLAFLQNSPLAKYGVALSRDKSPIPPSRF